MPGAPATDPNTAALFDDLRQVEVGDAHDFTGRVPFSLEAWVRPDVADLRLRRLFSKEQEGGGWSLGIGLSEAGLVGHVRFNRQQGERVFLESADPLPLGMWSHVAATYDGLTMRLYVDGEPAGSRESTLAIRDYPTPLVLGGLRSGYGNVKGALDEPAVYGRALAPAQIVAHVRAGRGG